MSTVRDQFDKLDEADQWRAMAYRAMRWSRGERAEELSELETSFAADCIPDDPFLVDIFDGTNNLLDALGEPPFSVLFRGNDFSDIGQSLAEDHLERAHAQGLTHNGDDEYVTVDVLGKNYETFLVKWRDAIAAKLKV